MKRAQRRQFPAIVIAALLLLTPALAGAAATSQADVELDWSNFQIAYNPSELTVDIFYPNIQLVGAALSRDPSLVVTNDSDDLADDGLTVWGNTYASNVALPTASASGALTAAIIGSHSASAADGIVNVMANSSNFATKGADIHVTGSGTLTISIPFRAVLQAASQYPAEASSARAEMKALIFFWPTRDLVEDVRDLQVSAADGSSDSNDVSGTLSASFTYVNATGSEVTEIRVTNYASSTARSDGPSTPVPALPWPALLLLAATLLSGGVWLAHRRLSA